MKSLLRKPHFWGLILLALLALYFFSAVAASDVSEVPIMIWAAIALVAVGLTAYGAFRLTSTEGHAGRYLAAPPVFMIANASLYILLAETSWGRYGVAAMAVVLVLIYLDNLRAVKKDAPGSRADLAHLAFLIDLVGFYFLCAFAFGIRLFYSVPALLLAAAVAVGGIFISFGSFRRVGIEQIRYRAVTGFLALLAAELYLVLSYLPVSHLVDAAVMTVLFTAILQATRQVLTGTATPANLRKELAFSAILAAVLLATARWL